MRLLLLMLLVGCGEVNAGDDMATDPVLERRLRALEESVRRLQASQIEGVTWENGAIDIAATQPLPYTRVAIPLPLNHKVRVRRIEIVAKHASASALLKLALYRVDNARGLKANVPPVGSFGSDFSVPIDLTREVAALNQKSVSNGFFEGYAADFQNDIVLDPNVATYAVVIQASDVDVIYAPVIQGAAVRAPYVIPDPVVTDVADFPEHLSAATDAYNLPHVRLDSVLSLRLQGD